MLWLDVAFDDGWDGARRSACPSPQAPRPMTHIVTGRCLTCRYTYCVSECPVDAFWEIKDPVMLLIDPDTCIDCEACVPACPVNAIWPEHELPEPFAEWATFNVERFKSGTNITAGSGPLPAAKLLEEWQALEKAKGLNITEPSKAS